MTRFERLNLSSRVFCIAAILGLSLAVLDTEAIRSTLLLAAVAATAVAADLRSPFSRTTVGIVESAVVALIVGVAMPEGLLLLPYLVIPHSSSDWRQARSRSSEWCRRSQSH